MGIYFLFAFILSPTSDLKLDNNSHRRAGVRGLWVYRIVWVIIAILLYYLDQGYPMQMGCK